MACKQEQETKYILFGINLTSKCRYLINIGNRTEWSPIRSVIIQMINRQNCGDLLNHSMIVFTDLACPINEIR